jgi:hypothetical protein
VDSVNYAMATGDTALLARLASEECKTCLTLMDRIGSVYQHGGRFEGGTWSVRATKYTPLQAENALVLMSMDIQAQEVVERAGASPRETPASRGSLELRLTSHSGDWIVVRLDAR